MNLEKNWKARDRYYERFGEEFPTEVYGGSTDEMTEFIYECIEKGEPYRSPMFDENGNEIIY